MNAWLNIVGNARGTVNTTTTTFDISWAHTFTGAPLLTSRTVSLKGTIQLRVRGGRNLEPRTSNCAPLDLPFSPFPRATPVLHDFFITSVATGAWTGSRSGGSPDKTYLHDRGTIDRNRIRPMKRQPLSQCRYVLWRREGRLAEPVGA